MIVQINGPEFGTKECDAIINPAVTRFNYEKYWRKKNKFKNTNLVSASAASCVPTFSETRTQTETESDEPSQDERDGILAAVKKIFGASDCNYYSDSGNEVFNDDDYLN